jgi:tRNA-2-methylthio-N6-dimethylallyladenosine synthase
MDDKFIQEFASNPKICKAIHMPLQSGSTKVLKDMKRGYTKEWFLNRVQKIKDLVPNVRITTDIIVAFPTETDEDFLETIDVIEKVKFDQIFNFKYSPRPNTSALKYNNNISDAVASDRLTQVIELHKIHQNQLMDSYVGKTLEVMFEALKPNGEVMGYSDEFIQCFAQGSEELLGKIVRFEVLSANRTSLKGKVIEKED